MFHVISIEAIILVVCLLGDLLRINPSRSLASDGNKQNMIWMGKVNICNR